MRYKVVVLPLPIRDIPPLPENNIHEYILWFRILLSSINKHIFFKLSNRILIWKFTVKLYKMIT